MGIQNIFLLLSCFVATPALASSPHPFDRKEARYACATLVRLNDSLSHLHKGEFERSVDWSGFGSLTLPGNRLTIVRSWGLDYDTDLHLELSQYPDITAITSHTVTLNRLKLRSLREQVSAGAHIVDGFQKRVLLLNEKYDWALDQLGPKDTIRLRRGDPLSPLLRQGFQIFTQKEVGFVMSANYDFLAVCPNTEEELDPHFLRERTFYFLSDPLLTGILNCEELLQPRPKSS